MRYSVMCLVLGLIISCDKPEARRPVSYHSKSFLKESVERNKKVKELEEEAIKYYIAQDSLSTYMISSSGFWYKYLKRKDVVANSPKKGDYVTFNLEISNLNDQILYSFKDLGKIGYLIDKEDIEIGLEKGFKLLKEGEEVVFLFPSYNALGVIGDKEKVGINQPLKYRVQLIKIN